MAVSHNHVDEDEVGRLVVLFAQPSPADTSPPPRAGARVTRTMPETESGDTDLTRSGLTPAGAV